MLTQGQSCNFKNLSVIYESEQRLHKGQCSAKIKYNPQSLASLTERNHNISPTVVEDIENKEVQEILDLCKKNPFYHSKVVHALKSAKYRVRGEQPTKDLDGSSSKISTFRHQTMAFDASNAKKIDQLMKQLKQQGTKRA